MKVYVGQTRAKRLILELAALGIGECTVRHELPPRRLPFFLDNGAFRDWKAGLPFDEVAFVASLAKCAGLGLKPDFVIAPDVVMGGRESLAISNAWSERLAGLPLYLAVQNGMSAADVAPHLWRYAGVFVGGDLAWKKATGVSWVDLAHEHGLKAHLARAGTARRVEWAHDVGFDSLDSSLPLWASRNLRPFLGALDRSQGRLFT